MRFCFVTALFAVAAPLAAAAEDICVTSAADTWQSEEAVKARATELGFEVANLKTEDGCYEVYATDKIGTKLEVFFHPVTFQIHKVKVDS
jgi:hypothetical protein